MAKLKSGRLVALVEPGLMEGRRLGLRDARAESCLDYKDLNPAGRPCVSTSLPTVPDRFNL